MNIISHGYVPRPDKDPHASAPSADVEKVRTQLTEFELGRFLLANGGLNGFWTSYILLYPERGRVTRQSSDGSDLTELEAWMLDRGPILLATQERRAIAP